MAPGSTKAKKKRKEKKDKKEAVFVAQKDKSLLFQVNTFNFAFSCFFLFFSFIPSIVIWPHQLNICHLAGFAPVFTKYHTNTKKLLSDALIFQAKSIRQPLLDSTMAAHQNAETKQTLTGTTVTVCERGI